jgi:hypothetical protein
MRKTSLPLLLAGVLVASAAWAQEAQPGRGGKERKAGRGAGDPLTNVEKLTETLKLDAGQQTQLKQLITEYQQAQKAAQEKTPQDIRDKEQSLRDQMKQARQAKDREKMKELEKQYAELRKTNPATAEMGKLRQQLVGEIEKILRDDQKQEFRKLYPPKVPALANGKLLEEALNTLQLRADQQTTISALLDRYKTDLRALPKGQRGAAVELNQKLADEVLKVLDQTQKDQLMKWQPAERPKRERKKPA